MMTSSNLLPAQEETIPNLFEFLPKEEKEATNPDPPANLPQEETTSGEETPDDQAAADTQPANDNGAVEAEVTDAQDVGALGQAVKDQAALNRDVNEDLPENGQAAIDDVLQRNYAKALLIDVDGPIFGRFHWYLNNRLDMAQRLGVDLIILRLTSPGGDLEYSLQLARRLRDIDWATTIVFIPQEAISGGAIISLGCDRIYLQDGALLGDAGPIRMGMGGQFEHAEEKVVSYLAGAIRELAKAKDRPGALAEAMVDRSLIVFAATDLETGETTYLTDKESTEPDVAQRFKIGKQVPETGQNRFLTVDASRAEELSLCEGVFESEKDLLAQLEIATVQPTQLTWVDQTVFLLNRPWLTAILLIAGLIGLYVELTAPGISVAGLTALCCFGIFFWSHALGGTAGWLEFLLFFLGITCLVCELFVLPGFGVFGISGIVLVVFSLVMASQDFIVPDSAAQWTEFQGNLLMVLGVVLGVVVLSFGQLLLLDSLPGLNRFRLATPADVESPVPERMPLLTQTAAVSDGPALELGEVGIAESDLRPSGKVLIQDRLLDVVTEGDYVDAGSRVVVIHIEGNRIIVRKRG